MNKNGEPLLLDHRDTTDNISDIFGPVSDSGGREGLPLEDDTPVVAAQGGHQQEQPGSSSSEVEGAMHSSVAYMKSMLGNIARRGHGCFLARKNYRCGQNIGIEGGQINVSTNRMEL